MRVHQVRIVDLEVEASMHGLDVVSCLRDVQSTMGQGKPNVPTTVIYAWSSTCGQLVEDLHLEARVATALEQEQRALHILSGLHQPGGACCMDALFVAVALEVVTQQCIDAPIAVSPQTYGTSKHALQRTESAGNYKSRSSKSSLVSL